MANYSTGMLANLNGQQNYFEPAAETEQAPAAKEASSAETGEALYPPQDPTGVGVLQKTLLPFDDHPYAQVRKIGGCTNRPYCALVEITCRIELG